MAITRNEAKHLANAFATGYDSSEKDKGEALWKAWQGLWAVLEREGVYSDQTGDEDLDFEMGNWANDVFEALYNARRYDDAIELNSQILKINWSGDPQLFHENAKRDIADCYARKGELEKCYELYEEYLKDDPHWGWAWIGYIRELGDQNDERYQSKLDELFELAQNDTELRDREDVLSELIDMLSPSKDRERVNACQATLRQLEKTKHPDARTIVHNERSVLFADNRPTSSPTTKKVGRNDPCPCGSGKKYKKCCGKVVG